MCLISGCAIVSNVKHDLFTCAMSSLRAPSQASASSPRSHFTFLCFHITLSQVCTTQFPNLDVDPANSIITSAAINSAAKS